MRGNRQLPFYCYISALSVTKYSDQDTQHSRIFGIRKRKNYYLNTIEQLFLLVEQLDQVEVCLPYSRLLAGIPLMAVFQNLRWNSNKTSLFFI